MAYQALYRKYRPIDFSDVYGQEHIVNTLKNEIKSGKIAHAYLFCGSRGTGKTTAAKIFSRAVNCPNNQDGNPCNICEICRGILDGSIMDVVEMDAASNNGVDDVRQIRDEVAYAPSGSKYKIYIIDEVHMLSNAAFNALLKTLEEPPAHIIFILATTEPHKIPATILSRCQKFDFKRIQANDIVKRLTEIAQAEGIQLTQPAAQLIANYAEGGMRDALSLLDQCNSFIQGEINEDVVFDLIGYAGIGTIFEFADYCRDYDVKNGLNIMNELYMQGKDPLTMIDQLIEFFKNVLVVKAAGISSLPHYDQYQKISEGFTMDRLYKIIETLSDYFVRARQASKAKIMLDGAVIKICHRNFDSTSLLGRIEKLEDAVSNGTKPSGVPRAAIPEPEVESPQSIAQPAKEETVYESSEEAAEETGMPPEQTSPSSQIDKNGGEVNPSAVINNWNIILDAVSDRDNGLFYAALKKGEFRAKDDSVTVFCEPIELALIENEDNKQILSDCIYDVCGFRPNILFAASGDSAVPGEPVDKFKELTDHLADTLGSQVHIKE